MPRSAATGRVVGYHYARRRDGTKYRVYSAGYRKPSAQRAKQARRYSTAPRIPRSAGTRGRNPFVDAGGDVIMGYGGYRRKAGKNVSMGMAPAKVRNTSSGVIISHREYVGDVTSTSIFHNNTFFINPGMPQLFPWLSKVAQNFEEWVPRGMLGYFKSTSSDAVVSTNANAALGAITIATDYNAMNPPMGSRLQMENYEYAVSGKPSLDLMHPIECSKRQNPLSTLYIRTTPPPDNADLRLYDLGLLQIATEGMQAAAGICGQFWITYEIELRKPKIVADSLIEASLFLLTGTEIPAGTSPLTPFGTSSSPPLLPSGGSTMPTKLYGSASSGTVVLGNQKPGTYQFYLRLAGSSGGTTGLWTVGSAVNCTLGSNRQEVDASTTTARSATITFGVFATGPNATFDISSNCSMTGITEIYCYAVELPDSI